jgi:hypothetical protein
MPVPIIAAGAAAIAARLAAKKAAQQLAKKAASKTAQIAKNSVKTKPARKPVGNPPNLARAEGRQIDSVARGGGVKGPLGKTRDRRVFTSNAGKGKIDVRKPARMPDEPARATVKINSAKTTRVVRVNPKKVTSSSTASVKRVTRKAAPKAGLETRGAKPTTRERINRARDLQWDKAEKNYDAGNEMMYTGLRSYPKGFEKSVARGPGKKNTRKRDAIRSEANKDLPIQINSARSFASPSSGNMFRGTDILKANNARALKAANRTRSGKSAKKK